MFRELSPELLDRPAPDLAGRVGRAIEPPADLLEAQAIAVVPEDCLAMPGGHAVEGVAHLPLGALCEVEAMFEIAP